MQLLAARYTAKLDFFYAPPTDLPVSPDALNRWLRERRKFQRQAVTTLCLDVGWTGYGRLTMLIGQLSDGAKLKLLYPACQVFGDKLYKKINCDYGPMAVDNFDKDVDVFFEFVEWVIKRGPRCLQTWPQQDPNHQDEKYSAQDTSEFSVEQGLAWQTMIAAAWGKETCIQ